MIGANEPHDVRLLVTRRRCELPGRPLAVSKKPRNRHKNSRHDYSRHFEASRARRSAGRRAERTKGERRFRV